MPPGPSAGGKLSGGAPPGGGGTGTAPGRRDRSSVRVSRLLGIGVLGLIATAFPQLATGQPTNTSQWVLLVMGSAANALLLALSLDRLLVATPTGWWLRARRLRLPVRLRVVVAATAAIGLLVGAVFAATNVWQRVDRLIHGCPEPTELRVLTTVDSVDPTRQLAEAYEQASAAGNGGCRAADVYVYGASDAAARSALAGGWSTDALREVGPRPDVWLPDSSLQVADLLRVARGNGISGPVMDSRTIAWSPIVAAVPLSTVASLSVPRSEAPWQQLLPELEGQPGGLVRPDPAVSVTGRIATTAIYASLGGGSQTPRDIEVNIAQALDDGGYPLGDADSVLCRQRTADAAVAIVTSEQAMIRYNRNETLGTDCPFVAATPGPVPILSAVYPAATPALDHQFVRLTWPADDPSGSGEQTVQAAAARDFDRWLGTDDGKRELLAIGLRPVARSQSSQPLADAPGTLAGPVFDHLPPTLAAVDAAMAQYAKARRAGSVLLALDTSGSMAQLTPAGVTRLSVAVQGILDALDLMGPADRFGLWTFPNGGTGDGHEEQVPIGSRTAQSRQQAVTLLPRLRPAGGTPLYSVIDAGVDALAAQPADRPADPIRALVVLTDGEDTADGASAARLPAAVRDRGVRVFVLAVGEASCAGQVGAVTAASGGACDQADFGTVTARLTELFRLLWGGSVAQ